MVNKLKVDNEKIRKIQAAKIARGEAFGPIAEKLSIDMPWLKYYSDEAIMAEMPKMKIYDYMMKNNKTHVNDVALYYFGKKITYKRLNILIDLCAKSMLKNGVKENDIVTICMPNTPEAVISFYALNKIGAVANMIHPLSGQVQIRDYLNEVNSKLVITMDMVYDKILNVVDETSVNKIVSVTAFDSMPFVMRKLFKFTKNYKKMKSNSKMIRWKSFINEGKSRKNIEAESKYEEDKLAVILHTGGTTGISKGVILTNDNFNSMVEQFLIGANNFERNDKMLTIMPVFHGFGLCSSIHLPLSVGVSAILIPKLDVKNFDKILNKYHPNHIIGVPTLFKSMLNNNKLNNIDLSYLKYVVSGGDLVKDFLENDINEFLRKHGSSVKLCKGYGLSEAVAGVTFAANDYNQPSSIGIPMVDTNMKIVKPGTDEELKQGEIGEICIKGPTIMKRYYQNDNETNSSLINGWLHTGDLGYYSNGVFYFSQRKGNMIISSGVNVYPSNIEHVIEDHEAVSSCAVVGIHHPYKIQVPKAFIILKDGYEGTVELKKELEDLCKKHLDVYSIPYSYEFRENLPQTLLGKISHKELSEEEIIKTKTYKKIGSNYENSI